METLVLIDHLTQQRKAISLMIIQMQREFDRTAIQDAQMYQLTQKKRTVEIQLRRASACNRTNNLNTKGEQYVFRCN